MARINISNSILLSFYIVDYPGFSCSFTLNRRKYTNLSTFIYLLAREIRTLLVGDSTLLNIYLSYEQSFDSCNKHIFCLTATTTTTCFKLLHTTYHKHQATVNIRYSPTPPKKKHIHIPHFYQPPCGSAAPSPQSTPTTASTRSGANDAPPATATASPAPSPASAPSPPPPSSRRPGAAAGTRTRTGSTGAVRR